MVKDLWKKAGAIAGTVVVLGAAGGLGYALHQPATPQIDTGLITQLTNEKADLTADLVTTNAKLADMQAVIDDLEARAPVVETNTVYVENTTKLEQLKEFILNENGDLSELDLSAIDDDGVTELVAEVGFIYDTKTLAVDVTKAKLASELDNRDYTFGNETVEFDERDIERVRVQDDYDEVVLQDVDFEDRDADLLVTVRFEQDDVKYEADMLILVKSGEVDDYMIDDVRLR